MKLEGMLLKVNFGRALIILAERVGREAMYERGLAHARVADHDNLQDIFVCKLAQTKTTKFQIIVNYREQPHGT